MKAGICFLMLVFCLSLVGCKKIKDESSIEALTTPFWQDEVMYNESVMMVKEGNKNPTGKLLFTPKKIITVQNYSHTIQYEEGTDYVISGNDLELPAGSRIPFLTQAQIFCEEYLEGVNTTQINRVGGGKLIFSESVSIIAYQISVTYSHNKVNWEGPGYQGSQLEKTMTKLKSKADLNVLVFGDSISTGANSTSYLNVAPYIPTWPELVKDRLEKEYGGKVNVTNKAQGGKDSAWGRATITSSLGNQYKPDLVIIGFGMNDGTFGVTGEQFKENILAIISKIKVVNPDAEFILLGTMVANPMALDQSKNQEKYVIELNEIAADLSGVVTVDIGKMHLEMLETKKYIDMTGNNVNHPNDFLARIYAMNLLDSLIQF